jgi:hypothetical protein
VALVIDENSKPGIYMGATKQDGKWYPLMTIVHPPELRKPVEHGLCPLAFDNELDAEVYMRTEVLPKVQDAVGEYLDHTEELRTVGSA